MKTYLVRTIEDQVLIGVFCEKSKKALIETISPLIEAQDCEYIVLNEGEGLFVEAQFVCVPEDGKHERNTVYLTNDPERMCPEEAPSLMGALSPHESSSDFCRLQESMKQSVDQKLAESVELALADAMEEVIPPVLEPTEVLSNRFNDNKLCVWQRLTNGSEEPIKSRSPVKKASLFVHETAPGLH